MQFLTFHDLGCDKRTKIEGSAIDPYTHRFYILSTVIKYVLLLHQHASGNTFTTQKLFSLINAHPIMTFRIPRDTYRM